MIIVRRSVAILALLLSSVVPSRLVAQAATPAAAQGAAADQGGTLTLRQALDRALAHYPAVDAAAAERDAANAAVRLARLPYWPKLDALVQLNRGTRNNAAGLLLPQSILAPISGPAVAANDSTSIWGTAVGALASWEPFDFGLRGAQVAAAHAAVARADAGVRRTRLDVAAQTAEAYLTVVAARQTVLASRAAVERANVLGRVVEALVKAELRPGVEASRARAEQASAESQLVEAEQTVAIAEAALAQWIGDAASTPQLPTTMPPPPAAISASMTAATPATSAIAPAAALGPSAPSTAASGAASAAAPAAVVPASSPAPDAGSSATTAAAGARHPAIEEREAAVDEARARLRAAERSGLPRVSVQGTIFGRGSGAAADGTLGSGADGLGLDLYNWAVGVTATIPIFDLMTAHARKEVEAAHLRAEERRRDDEAGELARRVRTAEAALNGARRIAELMPRRVEAAKATHEQALARYQAGLGTIVEVADAQRLLADAEIQDALAQLRVWRAYVGLLATRGSIDALLQTATP